MKFLIDECLGPKLTELAQKRGYGESSHIAWLGLSGPDSMTHDVQFELFEQALLELGADADLVNQLLEITLEDERHLRVTRYMLPAET